MDKILYGFIGGGILGFFACALVTMSKVVDACQEAYSKGWKEGYDVGFYDTLDKPLDKPSHIKELYKL